MADEHEPADGAAPSWPQPSRRGSRHGAGDRRRGSGAADSEGSLERRGYDIILAENGTEGLQIFQALANKISLVLLDLTMPGRAARKCCGEIKAIKPETKVVLSSGYNEVEVIQRFTGKGLAGISAKAIHVGGAGGQGEPGA